MNKECDKMGLKYLETERLLLVTMNSSMIHSLLNGTNSELLNLGFISGRGWPRQDTLDIMNFLSRTMEEGQEPSGYEIWLIVKKDGKVIIGDIGFTGPPDADGKIEIGYGLIEDERKKQYGYEAAKALIEWATTQEKVKIICAENVLTDNFGSIRILEKVGMKEIRRNENGIYFEMIAKR